MATKKSFKDNPALQFITAAETFNTEKKSQSVQNPEQKPANLSADGARVYEQSAVVPMKRDMRYVETKSKRVQLLMQPSLYRQLKEGAKQQEISLNEWIHRILTQHIAYQNDGYKE